MAFIKYGRAAVTQPITTMNTWAKTKTASTATQPNTSFIDLSDYPQDRYLFTQATIMGSVDLEDNGFYIKPGFESLVNLNGDCWPNDVTLLTYKSFRGAFNFLNHVQIPEQSKGTVLDAVPRWVDLPDGAGKSVYVDILVATDRIHKGLCADIQSGVLNTLSLGAIVKYSRCSRCGKVSYTGADYCQHLLSERREPFEDKHGNMRITSEICGSPKDPLSNRFIEASWVSDPAFLGAVKRHILRPQSEMANPTGKAEIVQVNRLTNLSDDGTNQGRIARVLRNVRF